MRKLSAVGTLSLILREITPKVRVHIVLRAKCGPFLPFAAYPGGGTFHLGFWGVFFQLCAGAARMSDVGELRYAAREPWGGSAAMFETVPYLERGSVRVIGPEDRTLEAVLAALQVVCFLHLRPTKLEPFLRLYEEVMPEATKAGRRLHRSGALRAMSDARVPVSEVLARVDEEVTSAT